MLYQLSYQVKTIRSCDILELNLVPSKSLCLKVIVIMQTLSLQFTYNLPECLHYHCVLTNFFVWGFFPSLFNSLYGWLLINLDFWSLRSIAFQLQFPHSVLTCLRSPHILTFFQLSMHSIVPQTHLWRNHRLSVQKAAGEIQNFPSSSCYLPFSIQGSKNAYEFPSNENIDIVYFFSIEGDF